MRTAPSPLSSPFRHCPAPLPEPSLRALRDCVSAVCDRIVCFVLYEPPRAATPRRRHAPHRRAARVRPAPPARRRRRRRRARRLPLPQPAALHPRSTARRRHLGHVSTAEHPRHHGGARHAAAHRALLADAGVWCAAALVFCLIECHCGIWRPCAPPVCRCFLLPPGRVPLWRFSPLRASGAPLLSSAASSSATGTVPQGVAAD